MIAIAIATGQNSAGLDPAASAFIQATGITGELQKAAINNLVLNLKKYNLWSKMKAVYPFVTDNRNLLSYTEDFGSAYWTSSSTGTTVTSNTTTAPNGTLTADSINENNSNSLHYVGTQNPMALSASIYTLSVYAKKVGRDWLDLSLYDGTLVRHAWFNINTGVLGTVQSGATSSITNVGDGWYRCTISMTMSASNANFLGLGLSNADGVSTYTGNGLTACYMWGAQLELGSTATAYQPIATTTQAFIASQFKYNLVNPVDSDAAFRLVFNGGWTHSSTGATPNGTNGFADTKYKEVVADTNDFHISTYLRTNTAGAFGDMGVVEGTKETNIVSLLTGKFYGRVQGAELLGITNSDSRGLFMANRISSSQLKVVKNATVTNVTNNSTGISSTYNIYLNAFNQNGTAIVYSPRQTAFSTIGDGLTDDDATNLYYSTQVFQTTLGRQVGSPAYALPAVNDVNAKLYLSAINSSDPTVNGAVDTFISGLKTDGIYSKMKAVYPFATDNRNLLSYTEDFGNAYWQKIGSSVTANTITAPNGELTADTLTENTSNSEHNTRILVNNLSPSTTYTNSIYVKYNNRQFVMIAGYFNAGTFPVYLAKYDIINGTVTSQSASGGGTIISSSIESVGNGWYRISVSGQVGANSNNIAFQLNLLDDAQNQSYVGTGKSVYIWGAQLELGSTATAYQPISTTQQAYIATQFKFNMINPQDDDSAFRLVFNGGWTHSPQGALPNGVNAYADTKFNPSLNGQLNSAHLSYYSRTNNSTNNQIEIGANAPAHFLCYKFDSSFAYHGINSLDTPSTPFTPSTGLFVGSRINSTTGKFYTNGSLALTDNKASTSRPNQNISLGALNNNGTQAYFTTKQSAFATIGDGLTDTDAANLYSRVQNLQILLNRQV